ncbi:HD domain-containing protein [Candidatus Pacearchaeota archaeon]|nr:HD domain-containing protein [Candidatus Pacearchaeota archaeon]
MEKGYLEITQLVNLIEEPNRTKCYKLFGDNEKIFLEAKGSKTKHQYWEGGYLDHIREVMNIAKNLFEALNKIRPLKFKLSDSLVVLFVHDLEKPWKYCSDMSKKEEFAKFKTTAEFVRSKILEYGFTLSQEQWNALKYVHGEGNDYDTLIRIQTPLAAFVNACDNISARIWPEEPKN